MKGVKITKNPEFYVKNVNDAALLNPKLDAHVVLFENSTTSLVVMSVSKEIPEETHLFMTQIVRVEKGVGLLVVGDERQLLKEGVVAVIPPGIRHRIVNSNTWINSLRLSMVYTKSPQHQWK